MMSWRKRNSRRDYYDRFHYDRFFPTSQPIAAKGGIKAQSQHGAFGSSWWAQRWVNVLESFNIGSRLTRGRSYARQGQVLSIDIDSGKITAQVQGSRPRPYQVEIKLKPLSSSDWKSLAQTLSTQVLFTAKLLAGEMPQDIEQAFQDAGLALFPKMLYDLDTQCSCPDYSNPCKHIAAVYYLIGEEFDRDPFLLFKLRGMTREKLLALLQKSGPRRTTPPKPRKSKAVAAEPKRRTLKPPVPKPRVPKPPTVEQPATEPLSVDPTAFWQGQPLPPDLFGPVEIPSLSAAVAKRLGGFPFWRGMDPFLDALEPLYRHASATGLELFLGEQHKAEEPAAA
jgi:uncharacterized Zn finger protein